MKRHLAVFLFLLVVVFLILMTGTQKIDDYEDLRVKMVETQLQARDIQDEKVLNAMSLVPRHLFVPEHLRDSAYEDYPLPIGQDQTISQPYVVALMTQALEVEKDFKVLEIGTGSGYQAAVLSELVNEVYTIEIVEELANQAKERLQDLGYENVHVKAGDGYLGWPDVAPFDAIIITAAIDHIPDALMEQLKVNGKIIMPLGERGMQSLSLVTKVDNEGNFNRSHITGVSFVPFVTPE